MEKIVCRSVFISDLHLGAVGSRTAAIHDFFHHVECENLYLVGDIVDAWVAREKKWRQTDSNVLQTILEIAHRDVNIFYTPGNHDAFLRRLNGGVLGSIKIEHSFVHALPDGRELLVVHGDLFDPSCAKHTRAAWMAAWAYEWLQIFNNKVNRHREKNKKQSIYFAAKAKHLTKRLFTSRDNFENELIESARQDGFEGVICGHVHRPDFRTESDGFVYINCGDWVEHQTVVIEDFEGNLRLVDWALRTPEPEPEPVAPLRKKRSLRERLGDSI